MKLHDQWALRVAHYTPWLTYWWNTQRWFPNFSVITGGPDILSKQDKELVTKLKKNKENYVVSIKLLDDRKFGFVFLEAIHEVI